MKTKAGKLITYGNLALIQIEVKPETTLNFRPGEPEIRSGKLIISESSSNGVVGTLIAENNTDAFLLLTDADVLIGAKQNRVLNKSVLLAPFSKTFLDVSCVERRRWQYTSKDFSAAPTVADHELRKDKAQAIASKMSKTKMTEAQNTQERVWSHIQDKMTTENFESSTESYSDLIRFRISKKEDNFPVCEPEKGCNALAVMLDHNIVCIDIFGTEDSYKHYFPKLRDSAFRQATVNENAKAVDVHEGNYKALDALDRYFLEPRNQNMEYEGAGSFFIADTDELVGFDLSMDKQIIHNVLFFKSLE